MIFRIIDFINIVLLTIAAICLVDDLFIVIGFEFSDYFFERVCRSRVFLRWTAYIHTTEVFALWTCLFYYWFPLGIMIGRWSEAKKRTKILFWTTPLVEALTVAVFVYYVALRLPYSARF